MASVLPAAAACSYQWRACVQLRRIQLVAEQHAEVEHGVGVAGGGGFFEPVAGLVQLGRVQPGGEQHAEVVHGVGVAAGGGLSGCQQCGGNVVAP